MSLFLVITGLILLLQTAPFQNYVTQNILTRINQNTEQKTTIGYIQIAWFDLLKIDDLEVLDYNQNVLLKAKHLQLDYDLFDLISGNTINLNKISLENAELNLRKYDDSLSINLVVFIESLKSIKSNKTSSTKGKSGQLILDQILLNDFNFSYKNDQSTTADAGKLDFAHFEFEIPKSEMQDFSLVGDTISVTIEKFSGTDKISGFFIQDLESKFELSNRRILLDDLDIILSQSHIKRSIVLEFTGLNDFSSFMDSVSLDLNLEGSYVHPDDIKFFADLSDHFKPITITGDIKGKIGGLSIRKMKFWLSKNSYLTGEMDLFGLPNIDETFINLDLNSGQLRPTDLIGVIDDLPQSFLDLGILKMSGQFSGFPTDFVVKANISTKRGSLISDLNLKFPRGWETAKYSGRLKISNFNAGAFLGQREWIQNINFNGFIKGSGLTIDNANFYTEAQLTNSEIYGYNFKSIKAKGKFASKYFDGELKIDDPNVKLKSLGSLDFKAVPEKLKIQAEIDKIDFQALGLMDESLVLNTNINFDLLGLNIDSLNSHANISNLNLSYRNRNLSVDTIQFSTENIGTRRTILFEVPDVSGKIEGNFYYSQVIRDMKIIANELAGYFQVDNSDSLIFAQNDFDPYQLDFEINYGDVSRYFDFLNEEIFISEDGLIEGTYYQRKNAMLSVFASVDSLNYHGLAFSNNAFDINIIKDLDSLGIMAIANLYSEKQDWPKIPSSSNLNLEAIWQDKKLSANFNVDQPETNSQASINSELEFFDHKLVFKFLPSNIKLLGDRWFFNKENAMIYDGEQLLVQNLDFTHDNQRILISGNYADSVQTHLQMNFENFELGNLNTIAPVKIGGILNGNFDADKEDINSSYHFLSDMKVSDLYVDGFLVGDLDGTTAWENANQRLIVNFDIVRESINTIDLSGYYSPNIDENQLDLELNFDKADLRLLAPLFEGMVSNLEGFADGQILISGNLNYPILNGMSKLSAGRFKYDYLGVTYLFEGDVAFDNEAIGFKNFSLTDRDLNSASVSGKIYHESFRNIRPEINISTKKFQFLNTTASSEELYYGTAYASGSIDILGSTDDLIVNAKKLKSEKGTKIYIPLQDDNTVEQKDYISFVDLSDTTRAFNIDEVVKNAITGVRLNFDMELTSDAYIELIFDLRAGDIIRGSAAGNLNLVLDTNGEFELFGEVAITEGAYNFTSSIMGRTVMSKEFTIQPGGTITWYGDPYKGVLKLNAVYRQLASLSDYRQTTIDGAPTRIPILVILSLSGEMLSPSIGFQIQIEDTQSLASQDDLADIKRINDDEQDLKRQVFSLLMLRKFSPTGGIAMGSGDFSSISEFLTNQLSYYASQFNENLEVDLDLAGLDQNAFNTLQLRLSYTFLDGRLRVSGGGGFNQTSTNPEDGSSFIGDWTVRYLLTSDGRLRINAFSQADQVAGTQQRETGVSLQLIKSFDDFKELVPKARERAIRDRENAAANNPVN